MPITHQGLVCSAFGPVSDLQWLSRLQRELGPEDVRVAVRAASVGFMDNLMARGLYQLKPDLPYVPGACGAGVVTEVGESVTDFLVGERVSFLNYFGAFAEEIVTERSTLVRLPADMAFDQGAAFRLTYNPAYFALSVRGGLQPGETLVVTGATGGVGAAAVQLGLSLGATVIAAVSSREKAGLALQAGAHHAVVYSDGSLRDTVKGLTGGRGADVVLDVIGGDVFDELTHCVAPLGRLLVMGFTSGRIPQVATNLMLLKNASVVGVFFGGWGIGKNAEQVRALNDRLFELASQRALEVTIGHQLPMHDAAMALELVAERETIGKIVLYTEG
ncbi:NADPH:quinone oxidoreductase family protein [Streptomyces sp. NPDC058464]|uniref:NADPH:quinone oxidoreductase family protein n=1 Tax=unclassified Streptomyces TaxID=2593676 RepID=UPI0036488FE5